MHACQSWHNPICTTKLSVCYKQIKYVHAVNSLNTVTPHGNQVCEQISALNEHMKFSMP